MTVPEALLPGIDTVFDSFFKALFIKVSDKKGMVRQKKRGETRGIKKDFIHSLNLSKAS